MKEGPEPSEAAQESASVTGTPIRISESLGVLMDAYPIFWTATLINSSRKHRRIFPKGIE